jgi:predicted Ser/Thr protein kinase/tetratricopeptide (TPR) repeat protein
VVERELARGGMGAVFVANQVEMGRRVALKVLLPGSSPILRERFLVEARAVARLDHPHVVKVFDVGEDRGRTYLAMELVEGRSLDEAIAREGPLAGPQAAALLAPVADALEAAHAAGILHRDLKPHNILIDARGVPRLTDFGVAKDELQAKSLTATGQLLGTPAFMAPEQAGGERELLGPASDVYGLGATLYKLLTGVSPFEGHTGVSLLTAVFQKPPRPPSELAPIDPALDAIVLRCLAKAPADRYPSARALGEALRRYAQGEAAPGEERSSRGAGMLLAAGVSLLVLLIAAGVALQPAEPVVSPTTPASSLAPSPPPAAEASPQEAAWSTVARLDAAALAGQGLPQIQVFPPLPLLEGGQIVLRAVSDSRPELRLPLEYRQGAFRIELEVHTDHLGPGTDLGLALVSAEAGAKEGQRQFLGWALQGLADAESEWCVPFSRARTGSEGTPPKRVEGERLLGAVGRVATQVTLSYQPGDTPTFSARAAQGGRVLFEAGMPLVTPLHSGEYMLRLGGQLSESNLSGWLSHGRGNALQGLLRARVVRLEVLAPGDGLRLASLAASTVDPYARLGLALRGLCQGEAALEATMDQLRGLLHLTGGERDEDRQSMERTLPVAWFHLGRALAMQGRTSEAAQAFHMVTESPDARKGRHELPWLDEQFGKALATFSEPELEVAAQVFADRQRANDPVDLWKLVKGSRRAVTPLQQRFDALVARRGSRGTLASLARSVRTHWAQALLALLAGGRGEAQNPDQALGWCWSGVGAPERARPLLEAVGRWEDAGEAAWQLGDHAGAVALWDKADGLSERNAERRQRAAKLAGLDAR